MRYVRFWRGNSNDFERITHKQEDTMYFVIQPDTNNFIIYLGDNELLSGDDLNSSSIDALEDVIISKNLHDRQVLMYDALQECWVNASLDKAAGAYVGPTADFQGLPGMLPGAPAGSSDLFFRSDGKWVEQHIEKMNNLEGLEHYELIGNITAQWSEVNKNDLIIIEDILSNNLKNDIAYWYDGKEWLSVTHSSIPSDYAENDPQALSYILNRPFYDNSTTESLEATFDGDLAGKTVVSLGGLLLIKLSDAVPTLDELSAGEITIYVTDESGQSYEENIPVSEFTLENGSSEGVPAYMAFLEELPVGVLVYSDFIIGETSVSRGLYAAYVNNGTQIAYPSRLYIPSVTYKDIKKLDNKFIDAEWTAYVQQETKILLKEQSVAPGAPILLSATIPDHLLNLTVNFNGTEYITNVTQLLEFYLFGNLSLMSETFIDTGEPFAGAIGDGVLAFLFSQESALISVSANYESFAKLPSKFLPSDVGGIPVVVDWNDRQATAAEFYLQLFKGWSAGNTVLVSGVTGTKEIRLLYLDTSDPLGDVWYAVFVTDGGGIMYTSNTIYSTDYDIEFNGALLNGIIPVIDYGYGDNLEAIETNGKVLIGTGYGFYPTMLNTTLTEGSVLPAQEGAVFTAINSLQTQFDNFQTRVTTLTETLESTLSGGMING